MKKLILAAAIVAGGILLATDHSAAADVKFDTTYQAVLLDNGSVYFGRLQGVGTEYPVLTEVYYVQSQENKETKEAKNILIRRVMNGTAPTAWS